MYKAIDSTVDFLFYVLNSAIPLFCIKSQESKTLHTKHMLQLHVVHNFKKVIVAKIKISANNASLVFTQILIPHVKIQIYILYTRL